MKVSRYLIALMAYLYNLLLWFSFGVDISHRSFFTGMAYLSSTFLALIIIGYLSVIDF